MSQDESRLSFLRNQIETRRRILQDVISFVCNPSQSISQKSTGVWSWNAGAQFPRVVDTVVTDDGCLVFPFASIDGLTLSIWVQPGEVRVGVIMKRRLMPIKNEMRAKFECAYDGKPCSRITESKDGYILDWIFREGFASHDFYMKMIDDAKCQAVFVDRLSGIITHLYMAFTNYLLDADSKSTGFQFEGVAKRRIFVDFEGDLDFFMRAMSGKAQVDRCEEIDTSGSLKVYRADMTVPRSLVMTPGPQGDEDGCFFYITKISEAT